MAAAIKRMVPARLWAPVSQTYWWWRNRGRHRLAHLLDPAWRANRALLQAYQGSGVEKRCFIIGNGPSLRQMDLTLLRDEVTFGLNRIYLAFPELGFTTTYLVSVNELVLEQCQQEMRALALPKFITWRARRWFQGGSSDGSRGKSPTLFLDTDYTGPEDFAARLDGRIFEGFTVTYVALQLAFLMGFQEAVLIGVDHNFQTKGPANATVVSSGADPNHFSPQYFGQGFRWQLPDLEGSERAYRLARRAYENDGRRVLDATVGGKLTVFPRVDYTGLFQR
jgi:hypothetical protein